MILTHHLTTETDKYNTGKQLKEPMFHRDRRTAPDRGPVAPFEGSVGSVGDPVSDRALDQLVDPATDFGVRPAVAAVARAADERLTGFYGPVAPWTWYL